MSVQAMFLSGDMKEAGDELACIRLSLKIAMNKADICNLKELDAAIENVRRSLKELHKLSDRKMQADIEALQEDNLQLRFANKNLTEVIEKEHSGNCTQEKHI